ncbi:FecCD family ABC transporter permease [Campylobacter curvus]|uniref:FecCD family ABC transporter permease n=1 Tax=Campylobacter curvus TaxID=200 RepID=UPI00036EB19F|nr:iron ABC transporter permease [Campylobacter curvus]QKF60910.1 iron ABC transporter, permease protein [Campylobacter curvus]UEB49230.1 iron ABC transporter permease [Campylobacter curvus]
MKKYIFLLFLLVVAVIFSLFAGRISLEGLMDYYHNDKETLYAIIFDLRLPRLIVAFLIGASLSVAGVIFQAMFQNPLVSPNILGVGSGAGFGAVVCILMFDSPFLTQVEAFVFGFLAVMIAYALGFLANKNSKLMLVLAGIITAAIFEALISVVKYVADTQEKLPSIVYWLMGSLSAISWQDVVILSPICIAGLVLLSLMGWKLNILSLGSEHASIFGESKFLGFIFIVLATLITSASVAIAGIIGWVGLLVPHITRLVFGSNNASLVPVSALFGGIFLMLVDVIARSTSSAEIPLSILTALIGAPMIGVIIIKRGKKWS